MTSDVFFDNIQQQFNNQQPFVVYRKPKSEKVKAMFQNNDTIYSVKDFTETGFVFAPFDDTKETVLIPLEHSRVLRIDNVILNKSEESHNISANNYTLDKNNHLDLVSKGITAISNSGLKKVVLSRTETAQLSDANPITIFKRLLNKYKLAFVYCWFHPKVGLWLGATPETLLKVSGNRFTTMALAGTQKYQETLDVQWSDKDKDEQQFVSDFILNSLKDLTDNMHLSEIKTIRAGNLLHLCTNVSGIFKKNVSNLKSILEILHPTPAVCGLPKTLAKQFILDNENYNREFYTGFLGELNLRNEHSPRSSKRNIEDRAYSVTKINSQLFVNLRCMQLTDSEAQIYIGGGITKDSNVDDEWQETINKSLVMKNIL
jgi:isochorismate synthase